MMKDNRNDVFDFAAIVTIVILAAIACLVLFIFGGMLFSFALSGPLDQVSTVDQIALRLAMAFGGLSLELVALWLGLLAFMGISELREGL